MATRPVQGITARAGDTIVVPQVYHSEGNPGPAEIQAFDVRPSYGRWAAGSGMLTGRRSQLPRTRCGYALPGVYAAPSV